MRSYATELVRFLFVFRCAAGSVESNPNGNGRNISIRHWRSTGQGRFLQRDPAGALSQDGEIGFSSAIFALRPPVNAPEF
jgi:hypothetical protein